MAVLNVEKRIATRFVCPTPASAAPGNKAAHARPAAGPAPHCLVEVTLSTRGTFVDRTCVGGTYELHVPDAPVLLASRATYLEGARQAGLGPRRLLSVSLAFGLGAAFGASSIAAAGAGVALGHALLPAAVAAPALVPFVLVAVAFGTGVGLVAAALDNRQWSATRAQFRALAEMAEAADRLRRADDEVDGAWVTQTCEAHAAGDDWVLGHAAMELRALYVDRQHCTARQAA